MDRAFDDHANWLPLLVVICVAQVGITALLIPFVGLKRNGGAVMGGADGDGSGKAVAKNGSLTCVLLAYNVIAVAYAVYCAATGTMAWFDGTVALIGGKLEDRIYGYSEPYAKIARVTLAYELYNTIAVVVMPEYRTAAYIGHHFACLVLAAMSMHPFCHYYATFFFGLTALSSVPLALAELAQACGMVGVQEACRVAFAVLFLIFRTAYWPIESYKYWSDALATLNGRNAHGVHSYPAHLFLLLANIGLTGLQFYWTTLIFKAIADKSGGGAPPAVESKKDEVKKTKSKKAD
jgi:hypothetical protein